MLLCLLGVLGVVAPRRDRDRDRDRLNQPFPSHARQINGAYHLIVIRMVVDQHVLGIKRHSVLRHAEFQQRKPLDHLTFNDFNGQLETIKQAEVLTHRIDPFVVDRDISLKAAARTKRDGGVKLPGSP